MRKVACWFFSLFLCGSSLSQEIVVASYNVENYLLATGRRTASHQERSKAGARNRRRR